MEVWPEVLTVVIVVAVPILGIWIYAMAFGRRSSESSETYQTKDMQAGSFVPLGDDKPAGPEAPKDAKKDSAAG